MKKKQTANLIMAGVILLIAAAGILSAGWVQGWFDADDGTQAVLTDIRGIINLEREGVIAAVEEDTVLRAGDRVTNYPGATAVIRAGNSTVTLGEKAELEINDPGAAGFSAVASGGEFFVNADQTVTLTLDGHTLQLRNSVSLLSARAGTRSVSVLEGTVGQAQAGQVLEWVGEAESVYALSIHSLNDFAIDQIRIASQTESLCFSNEQLDQLKQERQEQLQAMLTEPTTEATEPAMTCTITIRCDTILDNWDMLDPAKAGFVPADGVILYTKTVEFAEGETVFDVLDRVCRAYGIQLEYSWTPMYNSYYIEGINNLYEFDCGSESGWMYKVNGWFPNYGCSSYALSDGDSIVWCYTCVGLGTDVGA